MDEFANWLFTILQMTLGLRVATIFAALAFAGVFIWYTQRKNALTPDGAWLAAGIGLWVWYLAGFLWLLPLFFFFAGSTLLGRLTKNRPAAADAKHGRPRDFRQVLCNGGIYAALATWADGPQRETALTLMALSISVSTADTWSSEIGQYFRHKTIDILRWKPVPVGLSGGVSAMGMLGGLAGAVTMAALCSALQYEFFHLACVLPVACGGLAGMMLDSVFGAGLQARYQDAETGEFFDQDGDNRRLFSGFPWMSNDAVNLWSNAMATVAGYFIM